MPTIPATEDTPLVRTDFSDDGRWQEVLHQATSENADGFRAYLTIIDDRSFEGCDSSDLTLSSWHPLLLVADATTMTHPERPILCVDQLDGNPSFRVVPKELWGVQNNLSISNMDFDEFLENADEDGIFRGF